MERYAPQQENTMNRTDHAILRHLQRDATLSVSAVADRVGISKTACWRRIKALEDQGTIRSRVTLLDPEKVDLGVTVFALVRTNQHRDEWLTQFTKAVDAMPEVLEFYRLSGDADYLLRIVAKDIKAYDAVYKRLIKAVELLDVSSSFVMESLKYTTTLPIESA
jgi:Lrp/AsnC family transcriptional regulator